MQATQHLEAAKLKFKRVIRYPKLMLWAFFMEGVDTKNMLQTFARQGAVKLFPASSQRPTDEEIKAAMAQLKDLPRMLPFFVVAVVPAPGVTEGYALLALTLEKWLGQRISLLPSRIRAVFQKSEMKNASLK